MSWFRNFFLSFIHLKFGLPFILSYNILGAILLILMHIPKLLSAIATFRLTSLHSFFPARKDCSFARWLSLLGLPAWLAVELGVNGEPYDGFWILFCNAIPSLLLKYWGRRDCRPRRRSEVRNEYEQKSNDYWLLHRWVTYASVSRLKKKPI